MTADSERLGAGRVDREPVAPRLADRVVAHLLSSEAEYVNGVIIPVDGGADAASHMPRPMIADVPGVRRTREHAAPG
jgi:hypothetical protein